MQHGGRGLEPSVAALARNAMTQGLDALAAKSHVADNGISGLRWLERAHRLVPHDPNAALTLASACLAHDPARAVTLFRNVADKHDVRQAWLGLAAAHLRLTGPDDAAEPLAVLLSRYAFEPEAATVAEVIGLRSGSPGWCGLRSDGSLEIHATGSAGSRTKGRSIDGMQVFLNGKALRGTTLPKGWERARTIDVLVGGVPLLGSPILISAIRRLVGCVEIHKGGIRGWAWHPGDPSTAPSLTLRHSSGRLIRRFIARDEGMVIADTGPLSRPRSFRLTRADLLDVPGCVHITGSDGKDMPGSPVEPLGDEATHAATALRLGQFYPAGPTVKILDPASASTMAMDMGGFSNATLRVDVPVPVRPVGADGRKRAVTVVIPVHNGGTVVSDCLDSVLSSVPARTRILVVDDGSSDPMLVATLNDLAQQQKISLLRHASAKGFPAAANAGIQSAPEQDVVLLNSDTLVPPVWLERLREAAYASNDIGTVTPLSNDASILSYPEPTGTNPMTDQAATNRVNRAAERANGRNLVDIPVGVGFCLYLRRDCLNVVGSFRSGLFAQGYGEENDFCLRARRLGWRNVAMTGLFVGHRGNTSFGGSAPHLRARNGRIIEQLHPGYRALVENHVARDPLAEFRRRIDLQQWRERGREWRRSAILITHNDGGGVEQRLSHAIKLHKQAGRRPIVLRPAETASGDAAIAVRDGATDDLPNLVYAMPQELPALLHLLKMAKPVIVEAHHLADYPPVIYDLLRSLDVPYDVHVHNYAWFCPRISLVGTHDRYCGEPDVPDCESCVADNGHFLKETIAVAALRRRSAAFLSAAHRVIVPSDDTGVRMRRHFHQLATITVPHENDAAISASSNAHSPEAGRAVVCVVGGIGVHKGYDILLACARDAVRRDLDLEFVVVGHTIDDARLLATERIFVTGRFEPEEVVSLISQQRARLGFIASICPETWCLSLGDIWRAGLQAAAFDIGAPAERIRNTGRGILLPLGLSASAINNALVAATRITAY